MTVGHNYPAKTMCQIQVVLSAMQRALRGDIAVKAATHLFWRTITHGIDPYDPCAHDTVIKRWNRLIYDDPDQWPVRTLGTEYADKSWPAVTLPSWCWTVAWVA